MEDFCFFLEDSRSDKRQKGGGWHGVISRARHFGTIGIGSNDVKRVNFRSLKGLSFFGGESLKSSNSKKKKARSNQK